MIPSMNFATTAHLAGNQFSEHNDQRADAGDDDRKREPVAAALHPFRLACFERRDQVLKCHDSPQPGGKGESPSHSNVNCGEKLFRVILEVENQCSFPVPLVRQLLHPALSCGNNSDFTRREEPDEQNKKKDSEYLDPYWIHAEG